MEDDKCPECGSVNFDLEGMAHVSYSHGKDGWTLTEAELPEDGNYVCQDCEHEWSEQS